MKAPTNPILDRFADPTPEQVAAANPEPNGPWNETANNWRITTPDRYHLTAHDKKLILWCLEKRVDGCQTTRKTITLQGGDLRKGITPTHAKIATRETNAFGKIAEKVHVIPFNVNRPKPSKDLAPNHPDLFA